MLGNVYEWIEDCWHTDYQDIPTNGLAWQEPNNKYCYQHVIRGGSWQSGLDELDLKNRSAYGAVGYFGSDTSNDLGFRLAID